VKRFALIRASSGLRNDPATQEATMLALTSRTISRSFTLALVLAAIATLSFFTDRALADRVILDGTHNASDIKKVVTIAAGRSALMVLLMAAKVKAAA
jgi:hypothetical protein